MSVKILQPSDGQLAEVVRVASDATDNAKAIVDIEIWASDHGYSRSGDYWLQVLRQNGTTLFAGTCYRALEADHQTTENRIAELTKLREHSGS